MDNPFQSPAILSLCPGFIGLERGLQRAIGKINVVAFLEIEAFIITNLLAGMQSGVLDAAPIWTDIKTFDPKPFCGKIHGITGGYPCQQFSTAGKRKGAQDPRHLWPFIRTIVGTTKPVWCFFENVSAHLSLGFDVVYKDLRDLGFAVEAGIFSAEEAGAPHERERLFILAIREDFLGYAKSQCRKWIRETCDGWEKKIRGYCDVVNTENNNRGLSECEQGQKWSEQINSINAIGAGKAMAHPNSSGQPQLRDYGKPGQAGDNGTGSTDVQGNEQLQEPARHNQFADLYPDRWPARPGQPQHDWESPRTTQSGLGVRINGYNFREDLLRAYGNSVVEQTAEIAFRELLKKHFKQTS